MNTKITFNHTNRYDETIPNNNFPEELDSIVTDGVYSFTDWLQDNGVEYEEYRYCDSFYWVTKDGDRTGEAYFVHSVELTSEDLRG